MKIRLLKDGYKKPENLERLYNEFLVKDISDNDEFFSNEVVNLSSAPSFPIYIAQGTEAEKKVEFLEAFRVIDQTYLALDRDIHFDERFWHSLLVSDKRDYLLEKYPKISEGLNEFTKIVIKKFDWENYIYKSLLAVEYVGDAKDLVFEKEVYYELIIENLDLFNYIIKYPIFRNGQFLVKILTIIKELDLSSILKSKIKDRTDLGPDERYGRRVIFELNKSYPVVMVPLMEKEELKEVFVRALNLYYEEPIENVAVVNM